MGEPRPIDGRYIGEIYDEQAPAYSEFADKRFAWEYIESPAFDRYISDLYTPQTRVLEVGCGTGVAARHLIDRGVLPENIIGIDPSARQLEQARLQTPGATFLQSSADEFELPPGSVDLVITNTVLHHLDDASFERMLDRAYDALSDDGTYFFVEVNPNETDERRDPKNMNKWSTVATPWGTEVPFFNRDHKNIFNLLDKLGFDFVRGGELSVSPEGIVDPEEYVRYSSRHSRMAARYQKVAPRERFVRMHDVIWPFLVATPEQQEQQVLAKRYFDAWTTQSVMDITALFSDDATYDEKPGKKEPLRGVEAIKEYWENNPVSQENIRMAHRVYGYSLDGTQIWSEFEGGFDVRGEHVEIEGVIGFTTDLRNKKITHLTEHYTTVKTPR